MRHAIERRFHSARAARLHGDSRQIHPEIDALHQDVRNVQVIILDERHPPLETRVPAEVIDRLQHFLRRDCPTGCALPAKISCTGRR